MAKRKQDFDKRVLVPIGGVFTTDEMKWIGVLASDGIDKIKENAREVIDNGVCESELRLARVAIMSTTQGDIRTREHGPGGMGAKDSEIREARKWRDGPATMQLSNKDSALYLAVLYSMPVVEPVYPLYGPSQAKLALDLAGRIEELRCRQYIAAFEYTAKGYRLRKGCEDPQPTWTESPKQIAERAFGISDTRLDKVGDPRQLRLPFTD